MSTLPTARAPHATAAAPGDESHDVDSRPRARRGTDGRASTRGFASLFAVYLIMLSWLIIWKFEVPWIGEGAFQQPFKLVPFVRTELFGPSAPSEVIANVLFFVPFGMYVAALARRGSWWIAPLAAFGTSVAYELLQWVFGVGGSDISDVIANTTGAVIGVAIVGMGWLLLRDRLWTPLLRCLTVFTVLTLIASTIFVLSPLRYAPVPGL